MIHKFTFAKVVNILGVAWPHLGVVVEIVVAVNVVVVDVVEVVLAVVAVVDQLLQTCVR